MHYYLSAGLILASEIDLPGMIPAEPPAGTADVCIRLGDVSEQLADTFETGPIWQIAANRFHMHVPNIARFAVIEGREIRVAPQSGTPLSEIAVFLTGTVLGILLHQRGRIVLHASAVLVADRAILFCGPSGTGKSTLAAALNQRGYPVISDDHCTLDFDNSGSPYGLTDGRSLKLWSEAVDKLGLSASGSVRGQLKKFHVEPLSKESDPVRLGAIYELIEARRTREPGITTPNVVDTALIIRRNAYRPLLVRKLGLQKPYFEAATRIANSAGIYTLTRPLDFACMDAVIGWLETHWASQGVLAEAA